MKLLVTNRWPIMLSGIFASLLSATCLQAAEEPETIMVIGQQQNDSHSLNDVDLSQYTGFAKTLERAQFEYQFTTMPDVLKQVNSVQVKQSGGLGSYNAISLRGSSGKQVNVFLDGLLLNSAFSGNSNVQLIPSVLIERIQVFPDFTPVNLGNANIGGAINFSSRDLQKDEMGGQLQLGVGSFSSYQTQLSGFANIEGWKLMGAYQQQQSENDFPVDESIYRSTEATRQNDQYENKSGFVKVGKQFSNINWQLYAQANNSHKNLATVLNLATDNAFLENETRRIQSMIAYPAGMWQFSHRIFWAEESMLYNDEDSTVGLGNNKTQTDQQAFGLFNVASYLIYSHELIASLDLRQDNIQQEELLANRLLIDGERTSAVLALADYWQATDNWLINFNLRNYWIVDEINFVLDQKQYSNSEQYQAASLGTQYQLLPSLQLKANIGQSIRVPYLSEKYGSTGLFEGNPDLKAETSDSVDAGFDFDYGIVKIDAAVFHRNISDGIYTLYDSRGVGHPENIGASILSGVEAEIILTLTSWLEIGAKLLQMDSENQSNIKAFNGKKLPGIYHINRGMNFAIKGEAWRFSTEYQYYDDLYYNSANGVKADSQNVINSSLSLYLSVFVLDFSVRNWLDENFLDFNRMPTPGRAYTATLTMNF